MANTKKTAARTTKTKATAPVAKKTWYAVHCMPTADGQRRTVVVEAATERSATAHAATVHPGVRVVGIRDLTAAEAAGYHAAGHPVVSV
jgi:hypothetical protein